MKTIRVVALLEARSITGSAKAVLEFAREAIQNRPGLPRIELSIVTFRRGGEEGSLLKVFRELGVPFDVVSERWRFDTLIIPQLRAVIENRQPEVIWSNSVKSHFLVRWAGLNRSRRWVAFHHGYTTTDLKIRIYNLLDRWSLRAADRVLTSSSTFRRDLERNGVWPNRIRVQHMPIRPSEPCSHERASDLRRKLGLDNRTRVLVSIGRLSQEKGHANLVRALPKMMELIGRTPFRCVLVGDGPERARIERLSRSLGMTSSVTLTGEQDDVNPYYAIADVFALPSQSEGSPNVLLEAMAAGVPVVATATGGIPELTRNGRDALLVKRGDIAGLASATVRLLYDPCLRDRLTRSAREIVSRETPEAYFRSIVSIFQKALG